MEDEQPVKPANILNIVATNQGHRPLTRETPRARPLNARQVADYMAQGQVVVDARSSAEFGAGHIPGAINVQLSSGEFEQRIGWIVPDNTPIILVTGKDQEAQEAIFKMAFIALDTFVTGFLEGGIEAWMDAGRALATIPQIDVHTLQSRLALNGLQVLDVREEDEWDEGHIEEAHRMTYTSLVPQLGLPAHIDSLPFGKEQSVAVTCATGKRSSTAASVLKKEGFQQVYNVTGGMEAWKHAGLRMIDADGQVCSVA